MARVLTYTQRDGITSVSEPMPTREAEALAALLRESNPSWLGVTVEPCDE